MICRTPQAALLVATGGQPASAGLQVRPNPFIRGAAPVYIRPEDFPLREAEPSEWETEVDEPSAIPGWSEDLDRRAKRGGTAGQRGGPGVQGRGRGGVGREDVRGGRGRRAPGRGGDAGRVAGGRAGRTSVPRLQHDDPFDVPLEALTVS
jgi:hypothetical protein